MKTVWCNEALSSTGLKDGGTYLFLSYQHHPNFYCVFEQTNYFEKISLLPAHQTKELRIQIADWVVITKVKRIVSWENTSMQEIKWHQLHSHITLRATVKPAYENTNHNSWFEGNSKYLWSKQHRQTLQIMSFTNLYQDVFLQWIWYAEKRGAKTTCT